MIIVPLAYGGHPIKNKKSDLSQLEDETVIPGTRTSLEKLNTANSPLPIQEQNKKSRFILKSKEPKNPSRKTKDPNRNDMKPKKTIEKPSTSAQKQSQKKNSKALHSE